MAALRTSALAASHNAGHDHNAGNAGRSLRRLPAGSAQRFAKLRHLATPRNAAQRRATPRNASQQTCRGLDTLNGRSATRRPEKETTHMQCTEDIMLDRRMRLRQRAHSNAQRIQNYMGFGLQ